MNLKKIEVIPMRKPWTTAQKQYLRDNYLTQTYAQIAQATGHPAGSVRIQASRLGLTKNQPVVLTDEQIDYLRQNYNLMSRKKLGEKLGLHPSTMEYIAKKKLGLVKEWPQETGGVPMEKALTPAQCVTMRAALRALVHYSRTYKVANVYKFMRAWNEEAAKGRMV
jgi:hypothetical protein